MSNDEMKLEKQTTKATPAMPVTKLSLGDRLLGKRIELSYYTDSECPPDVRQIADDFAGDVFFQIFKRNPEYREDAPDNVQKKLLEWIGETIANSRDAIAGNLLAAKPTAENLANLALTDKRVLEAIKKQAEAEQAKAAADSARANKRAFENAGDEAAAAEQQAIADKLQNQAELLAKQAAGLADKATGNEVLKAEILERAMRGEERAKQIEAVSLAFGTEPGALTEVQGIEKMDKLAKIADLIGRLKGIALSSRNSKTADGFTPNGVEYTKDFSRIFTNELVKLSQSNPSRNLAVAQWAEQGLMGWEMEAEKQEKGNFYAAIDGSGSMRNRIATAKSFALALAQIAREDGRDYKMIEFGAGDDPLIEISSTDTIGEHFKWASSFLNGGTDFNKPLEYILDHIEADAIPDADIVFVTDGTATMQSRTVNRFKELQEEHGFKLYAIYIHSQPNSELSGLAEKSFNLKSEDDWEEIAAQIGEGI